MEQFDHHSLTGESQAQALRDIGFDMLRTIIASRQAASPTVRALAAHQDGGRVQSAQQIAEPLIALFTRGSANGRSGSFASDETVIRQDERHA